MLKPSRTRQIEALWTAIADILWRIGEKTKCSVVLPQDVVHIPQSQKYLQDGITEKARASYSLLNIFCNYNISLIIQTSQKFRNTRNPKHIMYFICYGIYIIVYTYLTFFFA
jgi:hypothetical protein